MGWSKVNKGWQKPIGWWRHKIACELWYWYKKGCDGYYHHLMIMCDRYGINLYGDKMAKEKIPELKFTIKEYK